VSSSDGSTFVSSVGFDSKLVSFIACFKIIFLFSTSFVSFSVFILEFICFTSVLFCFEISSSEGSTLDSSADLLLILVRFALVFVGLDISSASVSGSFSTSTFDLFFLPFVLLCFDFSSSEGSTLVSSVDLFLVLVRFALVFVGLVTSSVSTSGSFSASVFDLLFLPLVLLCFDISSSEGSTLDSSVDLLFVLVRFALVFGGLVTSSSASASGSFSTSTFDLLFLPLVLPGFEISSSEGSTLDSSVDLFLVLVRFALVFIGLVTSSVSTSGSFSASVLDLLFLPLVLFCFEISSSEGSTIDSSADLLFVFVRFALGLIGLVTSS